MQKKKRKKWKRKNLINKNSLKLKKKKVNSVHTAKLPH